MKHTGYQLSRAWFNFCFSNPEKITPTHTALYFFAVEHCNRLGWKEKFGLPTEMAKEALGVKSWHTYIKVFNDIIDWGFFVLIERSKNQFSSNIIALSNFNEANDEALDNATAMHVSTHESKLLQSNDSIYKLITDNIKPITENEAKFTKYVLGLSKKKPDVIKKPDLSEIDLSGLSSSFLKEWDILINMKKWKIKSLEAIKASLEQLSKYEDEFATDLVKKAISAEWQGVVFSDTDDKYRKWKLQKYNGDEKANGYNKADRNAETYRAGADLARRVAEDQRENFK